MTQNYTMVGIEAMNVSQVSPGAKALGMAFGGLDRTIKIES